MNDHTIRDMCCDLAAYDWDKLADRLCKLNQRDRAGTTWPDGFKARTISGDIPANDPEAMTPVERAADLRAFGTPEPDEVHRANVHALSALSQAHLAAGSLIDHVRRGLQLGEYEKPVGKSPTPCKSEVNGCDGTANKRGWCDPCRLWIWDNPSPDGLDPLTVPASVIEERTKRREKAS